MPMQDRLSSRRRTVSLPQRLLPIVVFAPKEAALLQVQERATETP